MGFFSTIGALVGGAFGAPKIGAAVGAGLDGLGSRRDAKAASRAGKLDLGHLRAQAEEHGFNPLTVLRATGGAGSHFSAPAPSFFAESARHFGDALDMINTDVRQAAEVENLEALTGLYRQETAAMQRPQVVRSVTNPVFASTAPVSSSSGAVPTGPVGAATTFSSGAINTGPFIGQTPLAYAPVDDFDMRGVNVMEQYYVNGELVNVPRGPDWDEVVMGGAIVSAAGAKSSWRDPLQAVVNVASGAVAGAAGWARFANRALPGRQAVVDAMGVPVQVHDGRQYNTYEFGVEP